MGVMGTSAVSGGKRRRPGRPRRKIIWKKYIPLYLMALPALAYILINNYLPLYGMQLAFRELDYSKGVFNGKFVGLDNFRFLFATQDAWNITRNTVLYNLLFIAAGMVVGLTVAILFNEIRCKWAAKLYQSVVLIPYFISMVIVSYLAFTFLSSESGFINNTILKAFGMEGVNWYSEPQYWPFILLFVNIWKGIGYSLLMYTARLIAISDDYYEAATLDGATKWQKVWPAHAETGHHPDADSFGGTHVLFRLWPVLPNSARFGPPVQHHHHHRRVRLPRADETGRCDHVVGNRRVPIGCGVRTASVGQPGRA